MSPLIKIIAFTVLGTITAYLATYWFAGWKVFLLWNAIFGYTLLSFVWTLVPRYLEPCEERDVLFPAFRRLDSHKWTFWMFVPGAVTLFPIRAFICLSSLVVLALSLKILLIGHKIGKEPLTGLR